jgi:HD-like signal output (HDOD) protein
MAPTVQSDPLDRLEERIERVYELPPMPELGRRILALQTDPNAGAQQLARIVQLDPSLAAQVIRYASSSYYGYAGRVTSIHEAIARVLGYDMVLNLSLGLAAGRSFRIPDDGPLGLTRFWEHAVCTAVLVQKLAAVLPRPLRPPSGLCYLCGLLHDFGILLLGHLFPPEFKLLNNVAGANPRQSVSELEQRLLGMGQARDLLAMGHARVGAWLMQAWKMPEALRAAVLEHHNAHYRGSHQVLVHLVQLADFIQLHAAQLPSAREIPAHNLHVLEVSPQPLLEVAASVLESRNEFLSLAQLFAHTP